MSELIKSEVSVFRSRLSLKVDTHVQVARAEATVALLAAASFLRNPPPVIPQVAQEEVNKHIIAAADAYLAACKELDNL